METQPQTIVLHHLGDSSQQPSPVSPWVAEWWTAMKSKVVDDGGQANKEKRRWRQVSDDNDGVSRARQQKKKGVMSLNTYSHSDLHPSAVCKIFVHMPPLIKI